MGDWDESDLQVNSLIALRLSPNLRTHLGTTSALTWTSLNTTFGQPHFTTIFGEFTEALRVRLSPTHNPQVKIQRLWTILECLRANGCILSDYLQGMILLRAIPKEWDNIASMYCNAMTMANITFVGVRDAIVAEFERRAKPAQVAHFADRLSAVKRKGKSPSFKEQQKKYSNAPKAPDSDAPQAGSSKKRTRRGGKKEKERRAHLVSSALIPPAILNRMQETHHARIVEVVEQPPAPRPQIVVGGPSRAPMSAVPTTITGFKPAGITYTKVPQGPPTQYHGHSQHDQAPFQYSKVVSGAVPPSVHPIIAPNTGEHGGETQEQNMEMLQASKVKAKEVTPLVAGPAMSSNRTPIPADLAKRRAEKAKAKAKKAKARECVHLPPSMMGPGGPTGPTSAERDALDQLEKVDWSGSEDGSDSEPDNVDDDIATAAGLGRLSLTPAPAMSSKGKGKQRASPDDDKRMGPDELDNNPSLYAYDDYGYRRSAFLHSHKNSANDEKQQLLIACSSLANRIEFINSFAVNCAKCKTTNKTKKTIEILADSGASASFTMSKSDLTEFKQITDDDLVVKTAANDNTLMIKGKGALFITHTVVSGGKSQTKTSRLYPVYYIPGLSIRLLSIGSLLKDGVVLRGTSSSLNFKQRIGESWQTMLTCKPHEPSQTLFWLNARLASALPCWHCLLFLP